MDDPATLARFWQQRAPHHNTFDTPRTSAKGETIVRLLRDLGVAPDAPILEVGCNVGRNLHRLWQAGYRQVAGLDISAAAVERLRTAYPVLAASRIDVGSADELLAARPRGAYAVVFTMAVLEHMHPAQRVVFREMARVARDYVVAIEPARGHASHRQYPWDVRAEFEAAGLIYVSSAPWASLWPEALTPAHEWDEGYRSYQAFVFRTLSAPGA